jgi:hypothetical protein
MSHKPLIIGFGHKARQGKDECCKHLIETYGDRYDIRKYGFADQLKTEVYDALENWRDKIWNVAPFNYLVLPHPITTVDRFNPQVADKVAWIDANKTNPDLVRLLVWWGTEFRRAQDNFYWVKALRARIEREQPQIALISDLRFKNEFYYIAAYGGYTVKVTRTGFQLNDGRSTTHQSEVDLDGIKFHFEIDVLDGEVEQLKKDACCVFEMIVAAQNPIKEDDTDAVEQEETVVAG